MFLSLLLALMAPAQAASDLEFKTSGPVLIYVNGQQAQLTGKLRQKVTGLEPGTHEIRVNGVFGKKLYEADIELPDGTLTTAEWSGKQLRVLSTEWLPEEDQEAPVVDTGLAPDEVEEEPLVAEAPPVEEVEPEPMAAAPEELPLAVAPDELPVAVEPPPVASEDLAEADEAVALPPAAPSPRTLTVEARDGMTIEIKHGDVVMHVVVDGDRFVIEDGQGMRMALGR